MISIPLDPVYVWVMVFLRTGFLMAFFPIFGDAFISLRIRIVFSAMVALALAPVVPVSAELFPASPGAMFAMAVSEALLGLSVGFVGRGLFAVVRMAGQVAGEQIGFGIINAIDPTSGGQISVIAELQYLLAILVFLATNMHHVFLSVLASSFSVLEPGGAVMTAGVAEFFLRFGETILQLTVQFAMPVIVLIFAINISMAMIGRAVPQVNVFLESFPLRIIGGLLVVIASLGVMMGLWIEMFGGMQGLLTTLFTHLSG